MAVGIIARGVDQGNPPLELGWVPLRVAQGAAVTGLSEKIGFMGSWGGCPFAWPKGAGYVKPPT